MSVLYLKKISSEFQLYQLFYVTTINYILCEGFCFKLPQTLGLETQKLEVWV